MKNHSEHPRASEVVTTRGFSLDVRNPSIGKSKQSAVARPHVIERSTGTLLFVALVKSRTTRRGAPSNCCTACLDPSLRGIQIVDRLLATTLALAMLANPALAIVTSDEHGSHVVMPGQPSFGINLDGVVIVGLLRDSGAPLRFCSVL